MSNKVYTEIALKRYNVPHSINDGNLSLIQIEFFQMQELTNENI